MTSVVTGVLFKLGKLPCVPYIVSAYVFPGMSTFWSRLMLTKPSSYLAKSQRITSKHKDCFESCGKLCSVPVHSGGSRIHGDTRISVTRGCLHLNFISLFCWCVISEGSVISNLTCVEKFAPKNESPYCEKIESLLNFHWIPLVAVAPKQLQGVDGLITLCLTSHNLQWHNCVSIRWPCNGI